ncbi:hypothetical protein [Leifsonia sp. Leaf264]|uniref:hypothetical protein n=1 Tax=Leifsonia sp. Leaf264 TaxID=1736314 RepID=UPI0006FA7992|nr:hypothetical protein [Leifsonia sp. Leaf264]KQO98749.1 hypothetical protein ASF30_11855 [Leifsonia sp. Leaf264]
MNQTTTKEWDPEEHLRHPFSGEFITMNRRSDQGDLGGVVLAAEPLYVYDEADETGDPALSRVEDAPERYEPKYRFLAERLEIAEQKIARANNRLAKLGIEERFEFEIESSFEQLKGDTVEYVTLTLNRPSISYDGWSFAGAHHVAANGNWVNHFTGDHLANIVPNGTACDHCGQTRHRTKLYTVRHPELGFKQIGASCLSAFLGVRPQGLWALESDLELDVIEANDRERSNAGASRVFDQNDLVVAALVASENGEKFVSGKNGTFNNPPTASVVSKTFASLLAKATDEQRQKAAEIVAWARTREDAPGSYLGNLAAIFGADPGQEFVRAKHLGYAVSAVGAFQNDGKKKVARKAAEDLRANEKKEWLAAPKEKLRELKVTVDRVKHDTFEVNGHTRDSTWLVMHTDEGHVLTWSASKDIDVEVGGTMTIGSASVKDNTMYGDTFQTALTNARNVTVGEGLPA